ncbi:hypothetical protein L6164_032169 [Bauhinia variegata]|uniref:Uncharacterized protein n=1 Tax=Bauhinia variegata TaxID=167791 RepID=A0ACB9KNB0_BAUVA|nr:hypothetical protein L6164_032169 [Bauhinia variegata]
MRSFPLFLLLPTIFCLPIHGLDFLTATNKSSSAFYNCTNNGTFAPNSAYYFNLKTLLSWLSSNTTNNAGFFNATVAGRSTSDTVHGFFYCRIEAVPESCQECVKEAAKLIPSLCPEAKEAMIWHALCFLRYSNRSFISTVEESPKMSFMNKQDYVGEVGYFNTKLWDIMNDLRIQTAKTPNGSKKISYKSVKITDNQTLYGAAWCMPYLSPENCSWCLGDAVAEIPTSCCRGKTGGTVVYPSCGVRYELYPIYRTLNLAPLPTPASPRPFTQAVGNDVTTLESLRFDFDEIEAATNNFSAVNRIGKGGFGEVYKGILPDGQEIAVKRLIGTSGQGTEEFKNEVLVIAKLQHRNLVRKVCSYESEYLEDIQTYAWIKWSEQTPLELLDSTLKESYSQDEVIKCIHIGLLCVQEDPNDRPTMATVMSSLNSPSLDLPLPHEPVYFKRSIREDNGPSKELDSISKCTHELTVTNLLPR